MGENTYAALCAALAAIAATYFTYSLSPDPMTPVDWDKATELCSTNDGVQAASMREQQEKGRVTIKVACKSGTFIKFTWNRP